MRNKILKATFIVACAVMFVSALATECRPLSAVISFAISASYVGLFIWSNAGRWDGVL